jgi:hypothetical protein
MDRYERMLERDDPGLHDYGFRVPRWVVRLYHDFLKHLNPRFDDDGHRESFRTRHPLVDIRHRLKRLGLDMDSINQFVYPDQVLSGHLYFRNGRQLHVRVRRISKGLFKVQAHTEWNARYHLFRHILYADLDYEEGLQMVKKLWKRASAPPGSGIKYRRPPDWPFF